MILKTLADGCFDPLHEGHIDYLRRAAELGLPLVVNVAPDTVILIKGREPFQQQLERGKCLESLRYVTEVAYYPTLAEAILTIEPMYLVKGMEWHGRLPTDVLRACELTGTAIVYTATRGKSSTDRLAQQQHSAGMSIEGNR